MAQLLHGYSCRSQTHSIFSSEKLPPNPYLNLAIGGSFALQLVAAAIPGLRGLLQLTPINMVDSAVIGASALLPLLVNEATKEITSTHFKEDKNNLPLLPPSRTENEEKQQNLTSHSSEAGVEEPSSVPV